MTSEKHNAAPFSAIVESNQFRKSQVPHHAKRR